MVGRKEEIRTLDEVMSRKEGQLVAVYGRRRVGKTYLIRLYFSLKSSVESLTQRYREAESAENIPRIQEE